MLRSLHVHFLLSAFSIQGRDLQFMALRIVKNIEHLFIYVFIYVIFVYLFISLIFFFILFCLFQVCFFILFFITVEAINLFHLSKFSWKRYHISLICLCVR